MCSSFSVGQHIDCRHEVKDQVVEQYKVIEPCALLLPERGMPVSDITESRRIRNNKVTDVILFEQKRVL
jgi:hypothetical protein